jgi:hypothetical protein
MRRKRLRKWRVYTASGQPKGYLRAVNKAEALELAAHMASSLGGVRKPIEWAKSDRVIVRRTDRPLDVA